jgi:hypothetical protein
LAACAAALTVMVAWSAPAHAAVDTVSAVPDSTPQFNGDVFTVAYAGSTIYLGGDFTAATVGKTVSTRNHLAAINASTGALLPWAPSADGQVRALALDGTDVYITGGFQNVNGLHRDKLAMVDGISGVLSNTFVHDITGYTRAIAVSNGRVYVGGLFSAIDGVAKANLAAFTLATGALDNGWATSTNDRVNALWATASRIYVGGKFTQTNGLTNTPRLRAVDPTTGAYDTTFKPGAPYEVFAIAQGPSDVYAALAGPGGRVMAFTSTGTAKWTITTDGNAQAVNVMGDTVYGGGHFDNVCKSTNTGAQGFCVDGSTHRGKMFAVDLDGTLLGWDPDANGVNGTHQIAVNLDLHKAAFGGNWGTVAGASHKKFVQFS